MKKKTNTLAIHHGVTLLEALISLTLILLAIMFVTRILIHSLDVDRKSRLRLKINQIFTGEVHRLLSRPFDSEELSAGSHSRQEKDILARWQVEDVSPTLKRFKMTIVYQERTKQGYFYKSRFFHTLSGGPDIFSPGRPCSVNRPGSPVHAPPHRWTIEEVYHAIRFQFV